MDKITAWIADARAWIAAATPRERRLLALAASGGTLFVVFVFWASFSSAIHRAESNLEEKQLDFEKISRLSSGYAAQEQERQMLETRLRQSPPALMSFVDGTAKADGVDVGGMSDRGVVAGGQNGRPREQSVEVNLTKVPLDKLLRLIFDLEHGPGVVKVRHLRVKKSADNKEMLDVSLSVSAWQGA
jgi:type II secretory pathway component PulM